jgi:hypothetical protein
MPEVDKRDTQTHLWAGGSDVGLQVLLPSAEAQAIYGGSAVEGWYTFGTLDGGELGYDVDNERDRDEAGNFTGKIITTNEDWYRQGDLKEDSDEVFYLLRDYLTAAPHRYRYALPKGMEQFDVDGAGTMETHQAHILYGLYNGQVSPGWSMPTEGGEKRQRNFEVRGSKTDANPAYVRKTVWLDDDTTWQYVDGDDLSDFQDDATP